VRTRACYNGVCGKFFKNQVLNNIQQATQKFDSQRFNLKKLNEPEVREQYQIEFRNRFAALENLNDDEDVNRTWEHIKENIQTSAKIVWVCMHLSRINTGLMTNV